ncbi:MAG: amylo-alpha-1,6-glucosidase [Candidatus Woesearchaeota archaeon]
MNVQYAHHKSYVTNPGLLISQQGSYYLWHTQKYSRYEGWHVPKDDTMLKIVDALVFDDTPTHIVDAHRIQWKGGAVQTFSMSTHSFATHVEHSTTPLRIILDCRDIYDFEPFERVYALIETVQVHGQYETLIQYEKKGCYTHFIALRTPYPIHFTHTWKADEYPLEQQRHTQPTTWYVYELGSISGQTYDVIIGVGNTPQEAKAQLDTPRTPYTHTLQGSQQHIAYSLVQQHLQHLFVKDKGLYAGLPWFFQFWTRDEAISCGGLHVIGKQEWIHTILQRQKTQVCADGRFDNRFPASMLGSADGIGWHAYRLLQHLQHVSEDEKKTWFSVLQQCVERLEQEYVHDDLIYSKPLETWMDTGFEDSVRDGACIEIQVLHQCIHNALDALSLTYCGQNRLERIKQAFWNGTLLADRIHNGVADYTIRCNGFLVYYLCPQLLTQQEWEVYMDELLKHLWCPWGGISSLSHKDSRFHSAYTGESNESYHHGDSWYFINNMAALCLYRLNKEKYKFYWESILYASTQEILHSGALGHHAEVSSASKQESMGCVSQAWSMALFCELYHEVYEK